MPQNRNSASLTREDREALRLMRSSHRKHAAEARLKRAIAQTLLELQAKLDLFTRTSGES